MMVMGYTQVFTKLCPWLLTLLLSSTSLSSPVHFNPCHDHHVSSETQPSHRSSWRGQDAFMTKVLMDLTKTTEVTQQIKQQLEDDFENLDHIEYLKERGEIDALLAEPLADLPFEKQLLNIYASLRRVELFTGHIRTLVLSTTNHESAQNVILTMLTQLGQGNGSGGGIFPIMCNIYNKIRVVEPVVEISQLIPQSLQDSNQLADIQDDFYHILVNTQRVLNKLTGDMQQISSV